ncbi:nuclear hormone receptor-like protein 2 [Sarcoptes scabiei]|uniref:Nuclear hormone receptor-like protein 2 n=1 Tax=Sarcoptes scabiei TaxID=52283 RepID=A0A132A372_SARSC|nr:nuclear hormone receptor-like protein 2 [Sarcoptes scabiei]
MATAPLPPPPPPPPMPGTSGGFMMPNWRDTYQSPFKEKPPTKEEIEKQQYAKLPDKLLNTLNKDKKPFTYTPCGVSSEKGILDLSEIRSPRMKKRLLANLRAGEDEDDEDQNRNDCDYNNQNENCQKPSVAFGGKNLVLPPFPDAGQSFKSSNSYADQSNQSLKKELRFAPSPVPVLACDSKELANILAARKQDVESRATIVTNQPQDDDVEESEKQGPEGKGQNMISKTAFNQERMSYNPGETSNQTVKDFKARNFDDNHLEGNYRETVDGFDRKNFTKFNDDYDDMKSLNPKDVNKLCFDAAETIRQVRAMNFDQNNNEIKNLNGMQQEFERISFEENNHHNENPNDYDRKQSNLSIGNQTDLYNDNGYEDDQTLQDEEDESYNQRDRNQNYGDNQMENPHQMENPQQSYQNPSQPMSNPEQFRQEKSNVLREFLDTGLQDEINKFEEMGAKIGSSSPEPYVPFHRSNAEQSSFPDFYSPMSKNSKPIAKSSIYANHSGLDGRTSCPPYSNYRMDCNSYEPDYSQSFRCISPSIEILKKTQTTGYNYISKPRPFYRARIEDQNDSDQGYLPVNHQPKNFFNPLQDHHESLNQSRQNQFRDDFTCEQPCSDFYSSGYSQSLPRRTKLNQQNQFSSSSEPRYYEDPEQGREYLPKAQMFSQLPPRPNASQKVPSSSQMNQGKMFYGINSRQQNSLSEPNHLIYDYQPKNSYNYEDPDQEDQVALVKGGVMDSLMIWSMMTINLEKECWEALDLERNFKFSLKMEMLKEANPKLYEKHRSYVLSFEPEWRSDDNLMSLLMAIALFNPDQSNIVNIEMIRNERNTYCDLLKLYVTTLYKDSSSSDEIYRRLLNQLKLTKTISEYHMNAYFDLNTNFVNKKNLSGLIMEIFDLNN